MTENFFHSIKLPLSAADFRRLPRNAAYKYELIGGEVWLSPRPKWFHAFLDLEPLQVPPTIDAQEAVTLRHLTADDWDDLPRLFAASFRTIQPYGSLDDVSRLEAARQSLEQTRTGGDGLLIERACFIAVAERGYRCGVILPTLVPDVDLSDVDARCRWDEPPPADCLERRLGLPHLTWVFVGPLHAGHGVGSALLAATVRELLALGYERMASTFLLGNDASMLWHWRNGFRLLAYPGSWRELRRRWK